MVTAASLPWKKSDYNRFRGGAIRPCKVGIFVAAGLHAPCQARGGGIFATDLL
ncbi:Uncharacterized protein dnm_087150 [Desulfonema magnum]|uniref:Uncharacterized protein n=1 Tax=Desulfonema magnum TaxID=45655 RepID=A0A975BWK8_9BACT|nr:Uncharacterized protein dnm_087150 [Desulfonema magnum]